MSEFLRVLKGSKRATIHPLRIEGRFTRFRFWSGWLLVFILIALPWTRFADKQTILLNIPERKFILFGVTFWPSDFYLMIFVLAGAALLLFLVTALLGRFWCGYACPQTVFLHTLFLPFENWVEGGRAQRFARDRGPWNWDRAGRKTLKHAVYILASLVIGHTLVAYFYGAYPLVRSIWHLEFNHPTAMGFALGASALVYWDFAFFREQFCVYACPYARFQGALMDADSLTVGYDPQRGEPRGKRRKDAADLGDCIDCGKCVYVCPTGIDIRDGLQLECIQCARCIDACDSVMDAVGKPRGLIRYGTEREFELPGTSRKFARPRVIIYAVLLLAIVGVLGFQLHHRNVIEMTVLRPPGAPFTVMKSGEINNHFTLRLLNKDAAEHNLRFALEGIEGGRLIVPIQPLPIKAGDVASLEIFVVAPPEALEDGRRHIQIIASNDEGEHPIASMEATFLGPRE